jgi:phage-related protein
LAEQAYAYVTLIPVAKGFQQAVAKEMSGVNNVGKKAGDDAGKGFRGGFGGALKGIAAVAGTALAGIGIGNFLKESVTAASDLNESLNAVSVSYGDATEGIVALGETAANRLGLSSVQFNAIATQFSGFASNIAGPGGDVVGFIDELSTRGADFASVFNLEVNDALGLFQSGLAGETEPLRKFGIDLSAATVEAFAYANGIAEAGEPLTEAQKQQARYGALLEQTDKVQGDFANTSDSLANAQRILSANFANVQATVGGPLLNAFANLTTGLLPVIEQMGPVLVGVIEQLAPVLEDLIGQIPGLLEGLLPLLPVLGELAGVFLELVAQLLPVFVDLFDSLLPIITDLVPIIAEFIGDALEILLPIFVDLVEALMPIVEALLPVFMELFEALAPVVLEVIEAMLPLIDLLLPLLIDFIEFLTPILLFVADVMGNVLVGAVGFFADAIEWVTEKIGAFSDFFSEVWSGIKSFFGDIINGLISGFEGFVNGAVRGLNRVIDAVNRLSFTVPDWVPDIGGKSFGFNLQRLSEITLPRVALAEGGLVTRPTNALIGEAGPEVVIPLDRFESMMGMGEPGGTVNYYAAPNKSFDAEQELLLAMRRVRLVA